MEICAAILFIILTLYYLHRHSRYSGLAIGIYILIVIYLTFLIREPRPIYRISLQPFLAARNSLVFGGGILEGILTGNVKVVNWMSLEGIILNILLFVPFGYLLPLIWHKADRWWRILLLGFSASLIIELLQLVTRLGYADVDDLINNTFGAMIGYGLYKAYLARQKK